MENKFKVGDEVYLPKENGEYDEWIKKAGIKINTKLTIEAIDNTVRSDQSVRFKGYIYNHSLDKFKPWSEYKLINKTKEPIKETIKTNVMKHKVGDKVRIKEDLHHRTPYTTSVNSTMEQYAGTIQTIKEEYLANKWSGWRMVDIDWIWTEDMFEDYLFKVGDAVEIIGNSNCSHNKIGDTGIITEFDGTDYRVNVAGNGDYGNWTKVNEMKLINVEQLKTSKMKLKVGDSVTFKSGLTKGQVVNDITIDAEVAGWSSHNATGTVAKVIDETYCKLNGTSKLLSIGMFEEPAPKVVIPEILGYKVEKKSNGQFKFGCKELTSEFTADMQMFLDSMKNSGMPVVSIKIAEGEITLKQIEEALKFMNK